MPALFANPDATQDNSAARGVKPKTDLVATVEFAILRLEFSDDYAYGSELETAELENRLMDAGPSGVAKALEQEGAVTLLHRGEARGIIKLGETTSPERIRVFIGAEEPYLSEFNTSRDDQKTKTVTQSTITSGATVEIAAAIDSVGRLMVLYVFDFDEAYLVEKEGASLVGRTRLKWDGTTYLDRGKPVLIGRFIRDYKNGPAEYLLMVRIKEKDNPS